MMNMEIRKWVISGSLTFVILLIGMIVYRLLANQKGSLDTLKDPQEQLRTVEVQQYLPTAAQHQISIDGRLTAYEQVNFSANVSGILLPSSKVLKEGTTVRKGELLFDIDQRKWVYNLNAQRSQLLNGITLMMPDLKLDYPTAYTQWLTYLTAFEVDQPIQPLPALEDDQVKFFIASRNIQQQYYAIKNLEASLTDFKIYAPFSGTITSAMVFPGTMVNPGQHLGSMINTSRFELKGSISEVDLPYVKVGRSVQLSADRLDMKWEGKVQRISSQIDPNTQNVPIFISVTGKHLKEGMFLIGRIEGAPLEGVVTLPTRMLTNQNFVYLMQDSTLSLYELSIVKRDPNFVYVNNIKPDQWVVSSLPAGLFEGQQVIPQKKTLK